MSDKLFFAGNKHGQQISVPQKTYDEAVETAKRMSKSYPEQYIWQAIAKVAAPIPEAEVTKLT